VKSQSMFGSRARWLRAYLHLNARIWVRLPHSFRVRFVGRAYGRHLHALVCASAERKQYHSTFFLRNRAELQLMCRLLDKKPNGSSLNISVLACSKGAEVYSILWAIRSARPDLRINTHALDISQEILEFAERGVYSLGNADVRKDPDRGRADLTDTTWRDQPLSIFERLTEEEVEAMFEVNGDRASIKPWLKEGITWHVADANDSDLVRTIGAQDMVVANRFLCHMDPVAAERCLRNIAQLIKPGGYLFVSGIDLDVRTRVARSLGWRPVSELIREVHEGDVSLKNGWPLEWWGLEPFSKDLSDWRTRYACVFQIGDSPRG
jgi:chemotaxis methyl-accepting protein methylase